MPDFSKVEICQVAIDMFQLSIRYLFVLLQEKVADNLSSWPGSTSTPLDASSVTDFFNSYYRSIQKPVLLIMDNYPTF